MKRDNFLQLVSNLHLEIFFVDLFIFLDFKKKLNKELIDKFDKIDQVTKLFRPRFSKTLV